MITRLLSIAVLTILLASTGQASELTQRLKPWDEASKDTSFVAFRNRLQVVVAKKDVGGLKKCLAKDIKNNFGGGTGLADFNNAWKPGDPHSAVWSTLSAALKLGGNFDSKTSFSAPYVYSAWPNDVDGFNYVAVVTAGAVLRSAPRADAKPLRTLDYDILEVVQSQSMPQHEAGPDDWDEVKDAKGNHGFVLVRDVRSPIDFRILFEKRKGKWLIASFVSGD